MLVHSVFFWLKEDLAEAELYLFREKLETLKQIPAAHSVYIGTPASTDRPVIDRSYDFALTVVFEDIGKHDEYQSDPLHKTFLNECSDMFEKVLIYDAD
ncbi:Dabb family protein [Sedimentisphaera salicampi]|uniref:Stress responsive A/B Barrel Domain protein n=1 Tax=Sedimentisphaera salicampi TaxID=1941349 RepID=A0A1W6LN30_9BACT|nr:Dabb family protein [Sedimentisphaera salicampi]ARN57164.1 Stress responsive A/B Barrel Domain protein [Sedimentisphaera salicampi]OXU14760.1 Stress responsive A/B Barrel Domain protein [Sedimentisphaera salicampi]